jgi:hypothetical protein
VNDEDVRKYHNRARKRAKKNEDMRIECEDGRIEGDLQSDLHGAPERDLDIIGYPRTNVDRIRSSP